MVNFNYVSSPKFVPNQKDFINRPLAYQGFEVVKVFESFQHHQVTDKPDYWHFENKSKTAAVVKLFISKIIIFATLSTLWCPFASPF